MRWWEKHEAFALWAGMVMTFGLALLNIGFYIWGSHRWWSLGSAAFSIVCGVVIIVMRIRLRKTRKAMLEMLINAYQESDRPQR